MPTCLRCGKDLSQKELSISNWEGVPKKTFFSCMRCGATWLYSKSLNCPVLIDTKNILRNPKKGMVTNPRPKKPRNGKTPKHARPKVFR